MGFLLEEGWELEERKTLVLLKKDCRLDIHGILFLRKWFSIGKRLGATVRILFSRKRFSIGRGLGATIRKVVLFQKDCR